MNNEVNYPIILSKFIDFLVYVWIFSIFFTFLKFFLKISKNDRNSTNSGCFFTKIPYHTKIFRWIELTVARL